MKKKTQVRLESTAKLKSMGSYTANTNTQNTDKIYLLFFPINKKMTALFYLVPRYYGYEFNVV